PRLWVEAGLLDQIVAVGLAQAVVRRVDAVDRLRANWLVLELSARRLGNLQGQAKWLVLRDQRTVGRIGRVVVVEEVRVAGVDPDVVANPDVLGSLRGRVGLVVGGG